MPTFNRDTALSAEEHKAAIKAISDSDDGSVCSHCGGSKFGVSSRIAVLGGPGRIHPVVPVICHKCGHLRFFAI